MHKKNTQRWSKLISTAGILAVLFGGLFAQSVRAVISNPTPVCVGTTCTLTFDATGDYYLWTPPTGARNITFDLMGAQGGKTGGLGGREDAGVDAAQHDHRQRQLPGGLAQGPQRGRVLQVRLRVAQEPDTVAAARANRWPTTARRKGGPRTEGSRSS